MAANEVHPPKALSEASVPQVESTHTTTTTMASTIHSTTELSQRPGSPAGFLSPSMKRLNSLRGRRQMFSHDRSGSNGNLSHNNQSTSSHLTEISYYSETEVIEDDDDEGDYDQDSSHDPDHTPQHFRGGPQHHNFPGLSRATSRQSIGSNVSAFTLGLDQELKSVSSLECDDDEEYAETADDISSGNNNKEDEPVPADKRILRMREIFTNSKNVQVSRIRMGDALLEEGGDDDDDDGGDEDEDVASSTDDAASDQGPRRSKYATRKSLDGMEDQEGLIRRFHDSCNVELLFPTDDSIHDLKAPGKSLLYKSASQLPPELDLEKAKTYLEQLANSIDEDDKIVSLDTPSNHYSTSSRQVLRSAMSEFTEVTVDSEEQAGSRLLGDFAVVKARLQYQRSRLESATSCEFTEVVMEEDGDEDEYEEEEVVEEEETAEDEEIMDEEFIEE